MRKKLFLAALLGSIFFVSCTKDKTLTDTQTPVQNGLKANANAAVSKNSRGTILYQATDAGLQAIQDNFIANFRTKESQLVTGRPSSCGRELDAVSAIESISHTGVFCDNTALVTIVYRFTVIEWGQSGNYNFEIFPVSMVLPQTATFIEELAPVSLSTPTNWYTQRTFRVQVIISGTSYTNSSSSQNTVYRTGPDAGCITESLTSNTSYEIPSSYYANYPPIFYVFPKAPGHGIDVANQCNVIGCHPPHLTCPTGGTFYYRIQGSGPYTAVNMDIPFYANGVNLIQGQWYDYYCVLNYSGFNTQPSTVQSIQIP